MPAKRTSTTKNSGHQEAQRRFPLAGVMCERCQVKPAHDRHHKDGNPLNNAPDNVMRLCVRCHMVIDGRLDALRASAPERAKAANRARWP